MSPLRRPSVTRPAGDSSRPRVLALMGGVGRGGDGWSGVGRLKVAEYLGVSFLRKCRSGEGECDGPLSSGVRGLSLMIHSIGNGRMTGLADCFSSQVLNLYCYATMCSRNADRCRFW